MKLKKYILETIKYALRSYPIIYPYIKEVENLYAMDAETLRKRNEEKFIKLFQRAYDKSPFYHKLYTEAGIKKEDIKTLDDIKKLPVITKDMVKQHADEMLTVPKWKVIAANTSGTTGTPLKVYESWPSIWLNQAYIYCGRRRNNFTYGQRLISLRGHLDKNITQLRVHLNNTLYLSSYNINKDTIAYYYEQINKFKPKAIEGYPSSLYSLALFLKDSNLEVNIPVAFTSSETLLDYQRKVIEQQLKTEVFDTYGMTERTIRLLEANNHKGYYESPGYSINEYVEDGEICTSLINTAFPMIRYKSNDVVELMEATEDNPQIIVKQVTGRKDDYILCKDGCQIQQLSFLLKGVGNVKYAQFIQEKNGLLKVHIVPYNNYSDENRKQIEQNITDRLGNGNIDFEIKEIEEKDIIYTYRGKFKYLINLMLINQGGGNQQNIRSQR